MLKRSQIVFESEEYEEEEPPVPASSPSAPGSDSESEPEDDTVISLTPEDIARNKRILTSALMLINAGLRDASSKGFLGSKNIGYADQAGNLLLGLLSSGLPSRDTLVTRVKSNKNIFKEYNSQYNKKSREELGSILRDLSSIHDGNFRPFKKYFSEKEDKMATEAEISAKNIDFIDIYSFYKSTDDKRSHTKKSSPAYVIINVLIPKIITIVKDIEVSFNGLGIGPLRYKKVKEDTFKNINTEEISEDRLRDLYLSIHILSKFLSEFSSEAVVHKPQKTKSIKTEKVTDPISSESKDDKPDEGGASIYAGLYVVDILPISGFDRETELNYDIETHELRVKDPLNVDLEFGIIFNKDQLPYEPYDLLEYISKTSRVNFHDALSGHGSRDINIQKYNDKHVLTIRFSKRIINKLREDGDDLLFSIKPYDREAKKIRAEDIQSNGIKKQSNTTSTTPLYSGISPSGERIEFTSTSLVAGGGYLRDSNGKKFKPKSIKGKSLASRVNSKEFGKVRK